MLKYLNKGIATPIAIIIILLLALIVGGFAYWQYIDMEKEDIGQSEIEIPEETEETEEIKEVEGIIKSCDWTMESCEKEVGKCYLISGTEIGEEIICASIEKKDELEGLIGKKVILKGINRDTMEMDPVPTKSCPCYIEYTSLEIIEG